MTLGSFAQLTEFELVNLFDIQSSHMREVLIHTIQSLDIKAPPADDSQNEDDEVGFVFVAMFSYRDITS